MKCKNVHAPSSNQSLKVLLYIAFKPVVIQFYTNRCHTRHKVDNQAIAPTNIVQENGLAPIEFDLDVTCDFEEDKGKNC